MEQPEIKFCSPEMEQTGLFWGPVQEEDQGLDGFLGDLQFSLASGTACEHQVTRIATAISVFRCSAWPPAESG